MRTPGSINLNTPRDRHFSVVQIVIARTVDTAMVVTPSRVVRVQYELIRVYHMEPGRLAMVSSKEGKGAGRPTNSTASPVKAGQKRTENYNVWQKVHTRLISLSSVAMRVL